MQKLFWEVYIENYIHISFKIKKITFTKIFRQHLYMINRK